MNEFVYAVRHSTMKEELTDRDREILSCITFGPWCKIGHGNTMSYNPKDGKLWFLGKTGVSKTSLQRINMDTLKPDLKINFDMGNGRCVNNNLTFDQKGRFYFYSYNGNSIRIYQGEQQEGVHHGFAARHQELPDPSQDSNDGIQPAEQQALHGFR